MAQQYTIVLPIKINSYNQDELKRFVHIQLRSLNKFLDIPSVYEFLIICKENEINIIRHALSEHPSPLPIRLLSENTLVKQKVIEQTEGWYLQQILKLSAAKIVKTPLYLILDADCFLTKPFAYNDLFYEGKIILDKESWANQPHWWLDAMNIVDGVSFNELAAQLAIAVTPQILVTDIVSELLEYLDHKEKSTSWDEYLSSKKFTEYSLYWLFVIKTKKLHLYEFSAGPCLLGNALWLHLLRPLIIREQRHILSRLWKRISRKQYKKEQARLKTRENLFKILLNAQVKSSFESNHYFHFSLIQSSINEIPVDWIIEQTDKYLN